MSDDPVFNRLAARHLSELTLYSTEPQMIPASARHRVLDVALGTQLQAALRNNLAAYETLAVRLAAAERTLARLTEPSADVVQAAAVSAAVAQASALTPTEGA